MNPKKFSDRSYPRAGSIGLLVAVITAIVMIVFFKTGIAPFPKPPSLAFAETVFRSSLPKPVGILFHTVYVTFWSVVYVRFFPSKNLKMAFLLGGALWLGVLFVFFPIVGWGIAGLHISPKLIGASLVPHVLFSLLLWGLDTYTFKKNT